MTETKTIEESRQEVEAAGEEATRTLEQLAEEQRGVAPEALAGDAAAKKRLTAVEKKMDEARRQKELSESALAELDKRAEEERRQTEDRRREELSGRYDELVGGRKELLLEVEKALNALDKKASALLEHDQQQRSVAKDLGRDPGLGAYELVLRDRFLFRLQRFLANVPGAASGRAESLTEDDPFLETIAEGGARKEEGLKRAEESRLEAEREREVSERAEKIWQRRHELFSTRMDYRHGTSKQRQEIEEEAERMLAQEFGEENS